MKHFPFVLIISTLCLTCSQSNKTFEAKRVEIGSVDSLFSTVLNERREIWVHVPTQNNPYGSKAKYPVVYLLDGGLHFHSVVGMIEQLSSVNLNDLCPQMIVVGIRNTDRTRDLTPTKSTGLTDTVVMKTSGGAETFTKFIETELIPYIDKTYPTTAHRTIIGHSFGGLFVVNTLFSHPGLFTNYIAIDPSLWWDGGELLHRTVGHLKGKTYMGKSLFVGIANTMKPGMKLSDAKTDTSAVQKHILSIIEFVEKTKSNNDGSLTFEAKYYENDWHGSIPLISTYDAFRFLYSWYDWKGMYQLNRPESLPALDLTIADIKSHYAKVSEKLGYPVYPKEALMNDLGYMLLSMGKNDYAYAFFKMNVDNYPTSANAFDSMGEYYLSRGDTIQAIATYEKGLGIATMPYTKEKLEKLKKVNQEKD